MDDVFGAAIKDYYLGKKDAVIKVHSEMEGLHDIPIHYMFRSLNEMPKLELIALKYCEGSVVDIGAGAGAHVIELQELGHEVTAIDNSKLAVKIMKKRGVINAICDDYNNVIGSRSFDTYLMLMNGLGVVSSMKGLRNFLETLLPNFENGSQLIAETADIAGYLEEDLNKEEIDEGNTYYGEITYDLQYGKMKISGFKWLYIDVNALTSVAKELGLKLEILFEGGMDNYLFRIFK